MKRYWNWKIFLVVTVVAAAVWAAVAFFDRESLDETIARNTREESRRDCPRNIDSYTTLDSMFYDIPSRTLNYCYSVRDVLDNKSLYTEEFREEFREQLLEEVKNKIALKGYKKEGIAFRYTYLSRCEGDTLLDFLFTKGEY